MRFLQVLQVYITWRALKKLKIYQEKACLKYGTIVKTFNYNRGLLGMSINNFDFETHGNEKTDFLMREGRNSGYILMK